MQGIKLFKKFLLPGGLCGAVPIIKPIPPSPETPVDCSNEVRIIRPSELPIYQHESSYSSNKATPCQPYSPSFLEQGFSSVRKSFQSVFAEYDAISGTIKNSIDTGRAHSQVTLDYLREEDNTLPRVGAVAIGGLTGLIFSLRGGKLKKLIYTTAGALSVGAICYPNEFKESLTGVKHYVNIAYNFVYGVKPGDKNQLEIQWPQLPSLNIPSSLSEFIDFVSDKSTKAAETITSVGGKAPNIAKTLEVTPSNVQSDVKKN